MLGTAINKLINKLIVAYVGDKQITSPYFIRPGMTVYLVTCVHHYRYCEAAYLLSKPEKRYDVGPFVDFRTKGDYRSSFSLRDYNVIPSGYNNHAAFFTEKGAKEYLAKFPLCDGFVPPKYNWHDDFDDIF